MAGRNHNPATGVNLRPDYHPLDGTPLLHLQRRLPPPEVHLIEDRIAAQSREIRTLLLDNQRLAATHVALKQDVAAARQDLLRLSATASSVKAERDAQVRQVYERSIRLEIEARCNDGLQAELDRVRADIKELRDDAKELAEELKDVNGDIASIRSELQQLPDLKAEIATMRREIQRGRAAVDYERQMQLRNFELGEVMENHMVYLAHEAEKLRSELANAEKRAMAATAAAVSAANPGPGYAIHQKNVEPGYSGNVLSDPYAIHQGTFDANPNYVLGAGAYAPPGPYDVQRQHMT
ncbi:UNVERIFIED_CONTAM: protein FLX-like 1 [Sesamum latifolium]|uniref:Protein FLX-like 1 n=1 Tax=Sesamum latifolium TaxID=2727402 RepID=A0AAW2XX53_9LAMI